MDVAKRGELYYDYLIEFPDKLNAIESQILLRKRAHKEYRIADLDKDSFDVPFPILSPHHHLDLSQVRDPLHEFTERFIQARVTHHTGLTLKDLLEMTRDRSETIFELCERQQATTHTETDDALDAINKELNARTKRK